MNHHYEDIVSRIAEKPKWWDEHAVPRYCDFAPSETANIYATEVALVEIECQGCAERFLVAFSWDSTEMGHNEDGTVWVRARERITPERVKALHYGDPPNAGCCAAGPTMNSIPRRVVEFWRTHHQECTRPDERNPKLRVCTPGYFDWRRIPELEIAIDCEWAET